MKAFVLVLCVVVSAASNVSAQTTDPQILNESSATRTSAPTPDLIPAPDVSKLFQPPAPSPFRSIGRDLTGFLSTDTAKVVGLFAVAGLAASPLDHGTVTEARQRMSKGVASIGTWGGNLYLQAGAGLATYVVGRTISSPKLAALGGDLVRAQLLSQTIVQGVKFAVGRERPDSSNQQSFPSGHSASAFATATVLQRHLGWKVGVPAYAFAGFVATSRMASSKHYLSDVLLGAGVGIAAGRTVTVHMGRHEFAVAAAPTRGGAMMTFTKR
jgi:membrane-associated phospholipid phosphatase